MCPSADCNHLLQRPSLKERILLLYDKITSLQTLEPVHETNILFGKLVTLCSGQYSDRDLQVLSDAEIESIRPHLVKKCSDAEYRLERFYAQKQLHLFPYHDNYAQLTRLELGVLKGLNCSLRNITFIGSGPLPLSSIFFVRALANVQIINVDISTEANDLALRLCQKELRQCEISRIRFLSSPTREVLERSDVVYVAALAGLDMVSKRLILLNVIENVKDGTRIVIRSADGLRTLLYPPVGEELLQSLGLRVEIVLHPRNGIVNSVIVATVTK